MRRRTRSLAVLAVASVVVLAGCGGNDDSGDGGDGGNVVVTVDPAATNTVVVPERRFFNDGSPWNKRIDTVRVDPRSQRMIDLSQERVGVVERPDGTFFDQRILVNDGLYINTTRWTVPVVAGGRPTGWREAAAPTRRPRGRSAAASASCRALRSCRRLRGTPRCRRSAFHG